MHKIARSETSNRLAVLVSLLRRTAQRLPLNGKHPFKKLYRSGVKVVSRLYLSCLRVPIIAVTGTNGKTTTTRLVEKILRDAGYRVGAATSEGVTHNGEIIWEGDAGGVFGALKAGRCPGLDVLVLETSRGGLLAYGVGFHACQVGIVTNVYEDHLGFDGVETVEGMVAVKAMIPKRVSGSGFVVLNADDDRVRGMSATSRGTPIHFSCGDDDKGLEGLFFVRNHSIYQRIQQTEKWVIDTTEIPLTYGGLLTYNTANVMAALAGIEGIQRYLPVRIEKTRQTLRQFGADPKDNFYRFCMVTYQQERIILNYSKNPESCRRDLQAAQSIKRNESFEYIVGILSGVGNRREKYFYEISQMAASVCDYFFVRPPKAKYLRGRTPDEIVRLVSARLPRDKILSLDQCGLPEVIGTSKKTIHGKILFVVFFTILEANIDYWQIIDEAELVHKFGGRS